MILNEVLWIILGIICMLQQPYWFYYLRRRVLLCSVWFSFSFDKVFNQKKKKKEEKSYKCSCRCSQSPGSVVQ